MDDPLGRLLMSADDTMVIHYHQAVILLVLIHPCRNGITS